MPAKFSPPLFWRWPNILSIDAALIAVSWQYFFSAAFKIPLAGTHFLVLGSAVWLAYAADRWIDGLCLDTEKAATQRHRFYIVYRRAILAAWVMVLVAAVGLAHSKLDRKDLVAGWVLVAVCLIYALLVQRPGSIWGRLMPKELWAAIFFAAGVFLFLDGIWRAHTPAGLLAAVAFCLLCFANCSLMGKWERKEDRQHRQMSLCLRWPFWVTAAKWLALGAALVSWVFLIILPGESGWALIVAFNLSGWGLFLIDLGSRQLPVEDLRVLGDAVLFSPILALVLL